MQNSLEKLPENPITAEEIQQLAEEFEQLKLGVLDFISRMRGRSNVDQRWLAIGTTDFEKGMMCIGRAISEAPLKEIKEMLQALKD